MSQTPDIKDRSGTVVAGKYRVEKLVARGGFSSVYRAQQIGMDRDVALKILELGDKADDTTIQRFIREARLVSQLSHPNTITIFDFGQAGSEFLYIAMEYVKGRSLSRQIKKYGALHANDAAKVALDILKSLEEAHGQGVLHRDLKPSNIMLGRDHSDELAVRVLDFGVAKVLEPTPEMGTKLTQAGTFVGTPRYASPEQMKGDTLTPASDVYGVGMILWECIVGEPAVKGLDFAAAVEGHLSSRPWRLPESVACPDGLAQILYRALEKKPANRYPTTREMIAALEDWMRLDEDAPTWSINPDTNDSLEQMAFEPEAWFGEEKPAASKPAPTSKVEDPRPASLRENRIGAAPRKDDVTQGLLGDIAPAKRRPTPPPRMSATPQRVSTRGNRLPLWAAGGVAAVVVVAGAYIFVSRGGDSAAGDRDATSSSAQATLPLIGSQGIVMAMRTAGWDTRNFEESTFEDVFQMSFMAEKDNRKAAVTIYECQSDQLAGALLRDTELPSEAVQYGRTIVRVSPGPSNEGNGVQHVTAMLFEFRGMLQKQGKL